MTLGLAVFGLGLPDAHALEVEGPKRGPKRAILQKVARAATCVLKLAAFREELTARKSFYESAHTGAEVLKTFDRDAVCKLGTYRRGGLFGYLIYWDQVDAMHQPGSSVVRFNLNTFRDNDLPFLVGTAIHECAHFLGYTHSKNDRFKFPSMEKTVPYQVGFMARRHAPACL